MHVLLTDPVCIRRAWLVFVSQENVHCAHGHTLRASSECRNNALLYYGVFYVIVTQLTKCLLACGAILRLAKCDRADYKRPTLHNVGQPIVGHIYAHEQGIPPHRLPFLRGTL